MFIFLYSYSLETIPVQYLCAPKILVPLIRVRKIWHYRYYFVLCEVKIKGSGSRSTCSLVCQVVPPQFSFKHHQWVTCYSLTELTLQSIYSVLNNWSFLKVINFPDKILKQSICFVCVIYLFVNVYLTLKLLSQTG